MELVVEPGDQIQRWTIYKELKSWLCSPRSSRLIRRSRTGQALNKWILSSKNSNHDGGAWRTSALYSGVFLSPLYILSMDFLLPRVFYFSNSHGYSLLIFFRFQRIEEEWSRFSKSKSRPSLSLRFSALQNNTRRSQAVNSNEVYFKQNNTQKGISFRG